MERRLFSSLSAAEIHFLRSALMKFLGSQSETRAAASRKEDDIRRRAPRQNDSELV